MAFDLQASFISQTTNRISLNNVISLVSFLVCLSFVSKRVLFYELILYLATLLKVFIICRSFPVGFLGSFVYTIISYTNKDPLTSSFPICTTLMSFSCLIVLVKTSSTILKRYGKSVQLCLAPDFRGITLSFSLI